MVVWSCDRSWSVCKVFLVSYVASLVSDVCVVVCVGYEYPEKVTAMVVWLR